ncbi:MAG: DUF4038 domain-containing protein [Opitutaceae bacterium]|nr:DUF4038 domain-containing protein [Opitutaceae bacterium]
MKSSLSALYQQQAGRRPALPGFLSLALILLRISSVAVAQPAVPRFTPHEISFEASGAYANPYVECAADAVLTEPDGGTTRTLPLFWDGGSRWKLRFSPDQTGNWQWAVKSADRGLDGRSGSFSCVESSRRGSIQPAAGASRHFQYQNGERMWFLGDTAWSLLSDSAEEKHGRAAAERYLRNRAAQGFNVVHSMMLNEAGWPNRGGPPWLDLAVEKINPAYFQEADERIAFANAQGFVTGLALAWGDKGRKEPWSWGRFPTIAARLRYARYIAARFGAYNVYFLVSGEWHGEVRSRPAAAADVVREFVQIGDALRAADAQRRMIGIHPMTAQGSTREFNAAAAWMDFADYQQNYDELHARALASRPVPKPVVNSEYGYYLRDQNGDGRVDKPHSYTVDDMRHATWDIVMAGSYVVTGFGSTYMGGNRHPTPFLPDDARNTVWADQIGRVKELLTSLDYWKLEPHDEWLTAATPRSADRIDKPESGRGATLIRAPQTAYWCLAERGRTYIVYTRGLREPLALRVSGGMRWNARRFNPRTGERETVPLGVGARGVQLPPPDDRDWVFVVRSGRR